MALVDLLLSEGMVHGIVAEEDRRVDGAFRHPLALVAILEAESIQIAHRGRRDRRRNIRPRYLTVS